MIIRLLLSVMLSLALLGQSPSHAADTFVPPAKLGLIDDSFGPFTLGVTTPKDAKKYRTEPSFMRWSLQFPGSVCITNLIFINKSDDAKLGAVLLRMHRAYSISNPSKFPVYYQQGRTQDRYLVRTRANALVCAGNNRRGICIICWAILAKPDTIDQVCYQLSNDPTQIIPQVDPGAGRPKKLLFGKVTVDTTGAPHTHLDNQSLTMLLQGMEAMTCGDTARYSPGAAGSATLTVTDQVDSHAGLIVTASFAMDGETPYGHIGDSSQPHQITMGWVEKNDQGSAGAQFGRNLGISKIIADAESEVASNIQTQVSSQAPPTRP